MIEAALQWALEDGVPVFPVGVHKRPLVEGGFKAATLDEAVIRAWWDEWPEAGIGGATGTACGAWVLDIDLGKGGPASLAELEAEHGPLPPTRRTRTGGGGSHLWFVMPADRPVKNRADVRPGIDVRGTGGYVVLPPSRHESGRQYVLEDDRAPAEAPEWLIEIVAPIGRAAERTAPSKRGELGGPDERRRLMGMVLAAADRIRSTPEGGRNDAVNRECFGVGGFLAGSSLSVDEVAPLLEAAAVDAEQPIGSVRRALRDGMAMPRELPPDSEDHQARQLRWERSQHSSPRVPEPPIDALLQEAQGQDQAQQRQAGPGVAGGAVASDGPYLVLVGTSSSVWFVRRSDGRGYVSVSEKVLRTELKRLHPDLKTATYPEEGPPKPMGPAALFERYGRRADELVYTYTGNSGYRYGEEGGGTLVQRVCRPDAQLVPERSEAVEAWLQQLAGDQYGAACDWLGGSLRLDEPIAALYLEGPNSSGKGMLADALARCFGAGVCDYGDAAGITSPFNSVLRTSPVIWLDERAPASKNGSAAFRRLTGNRKHAIHEKHRPSATLLGCPRVIIGANGPNALRLGEQEDLEQADEDAVAIRILHVRVSKAARAYLARLGGYAHTSTWVDDGERPGALCRHIAWLAEQRADVRGAGGRFLVEGSSHDWLSGAARREGWPRRVLLALARAASGADLRLDVDERPVFYRSGEGWVRAEQLKRAWKLLTDEDRPPSDKALGEALGLLARTETSDGKPERVSPHELGVGKRAWVRRIAGPLVVAAAEELGIGDPDEIRARYACK